MKGLCHALPEPGAWARQRSWHAFPGCRARLRGRAATVHHRLSAGAGAAVFPTNLHLNRGSSVCDQDAFDDMTEYQLKSGGLSRRQFGALTLGCGPDLDAAAGGECGGGHRGGGGDQDPGRHRGCLFRASGRRARIRQCSSGRISSACVRRSGRWASAWPSRATRCSWSIPSTAEESPDRPGTSGFQRPADTRAALMGLMGTLTQDSDVHRCQGLHCLAGQPGRRGPQRRRSAPRATAWADR